MKLLLAIGATLFTLMSPLQNGQKDQTDLVVVKFACDRYERGGRMVRSVQDPDSNMNEPIRINQLPKNEPQEVINRRDMSERRAEMRAAEINAELSKHSNGATFYHYRLEVRNANSQTVRRFAWSYQPGEIPDLSDRQFFCVVDAKPNEAKIFDLFTPLAPSRVIDASKAGDKAEKDLKQNVMINFIEYADGSVWKRPGWNAATFSAEHKEKVAHGKCIGL